MRALALCLSLLLLTACGSLSSFRVLAPSAFDMDQAEPNVYVEPTMSMAQREQLQRQINLGRAQVERFFGALHTTPYFVACATPACALRFGSHGERAAAFGDQAIRLSHNGLTAPVVAHEWVHAEVYRRVGGAWKVGRIPRWFDEGLAVVIADEARHSETNWREIQRRGQATPALAELMSRRDWVAAVIRYGEPNVDDPNNLRVVYSTAGHELRRWLACAGPAGTLALLGAVRAGEPFAAAYGRLGGRCVG